jgi:transposase-like protein
MGKMKEVFMKMIEQESFNIPEEYSFYKTEVLCPNCNKSNLIQVSKNDYTCDKCAQNFILVENSLKFK